MSKWIPALKFRNLDEARAVLRQIGHDPGVDLFDDGGAEPQGLLAVIPEDRMDERSFYQLFDQKKGTSVRVEKIPYSGYGPPAEERNYMGFVREKIAYVLEGCRLSIEISDCPQGAVDIHHLEALVLDQMHPLNRDDLAERLGLEPDWEFEDLFELIANHEVTAQKIDRLIHQGIQ
ncbi:MAG: hypothetical protein EHM61_03755 [Acidobacteria bacterium]|nr:MAG: hypothetical protein EHM61_03755 [Acidobacteriota bacterium]